jgi:alpha-1,6-mannosyltransferase
MSSAPLESVDPAAEQFETTTAFTLRHVVPGAVGSLLLSIGALGVGWLPINTAFADGGIVNALKTSTTGSIIARLCVLIGLALLIQAWLVLGADVMSGRSPSVFRLRVLMCTWTAPLIFSPPLFSRDVYSYFVQGKLVAHGLNPYVNGVIDLPGWFNDGADPTWGASPTPYGPLFLLIERGISTAVQEHPLTATLLFRLVSLVGIALLLKFVPRLAFAGGIDPRKALWLAVLNPIVLMHFVADAHNDSLMIGLVVAGLTLAAEGSYISGLVLIAVGSAVKPIGLLAVPFAGLLSVGANARLRSRTLSWVIGLGVTSAVFVVLSVVVDVGPGWVSALLTPGQLHTWLSPSTAIGLGVSTLLRVVGLGDHEVVLLTATHSIGTVLAALLMLRLLIWPAGRSPVRGAALAFLTIVVLAPTVQPWYLLWALPLFAASGLTRHQLQFTVLLSTALGVHGLVTSAAAASTVLNFSPGTSILAAALVIVGVLLVSRRERTLVLGAPVGNGLFPEDPPARGRALRLSN